ncbi:MAG: hemolysin family protein [Lachnospiraceae bacterium]|nr:hemolysin family protein [Agathobacter sp.]MDD6291102.1 hemolysin family protein [Lachnospiraceae bacterium]
MGPSDIIQFTVLILLLLLSAFFSSAETALTTVNKIRMRTLSEAGDKRASRVLRITDDSGKMLSAILIGNNIVNLSASSLATSIALKYLGSAGAGIATGILTFLILIFGEVSPKTMATIKADQLSLKISGIIETLMKLLTPVIFVINQLSMGLLFLLRINPKDAEKQMTEAELRTIVDVSQESGVIENEERDMIHNLFDFGDAEAKEIMVPRIDMTFVQADASYQEVLDVFRQDMFTRIPVYEDTTDNVIGIINMKDFLLQNDTPEFSVRAMLREPYFTYEHKNTADLFLEMRKSSLSLAIVLDEYGVTAGLITLEDLLEEIVGDIRDEYDADEEDDITPISDREFYVLGSANLDDVSDALSVNFTSDDYDTIGGYCLGLLDHLPEKNEIILTDDNILLRIDRVDKNRIERIYIRLPEPLENASSD